jgi:hypothetical protein
MTGAVCILGVWQRLHPIAENSTLPCLALAPGFDRQWKPISDQEATVGLDHELAGAVALGVAYTWRRRDDFQYAPFLAGPCTGEPSAASCPTVGPADYTANAPVTVNGFTAFTYSPNPGLVAAGGGGRLYTNYPDYH